MQFESPFNNPQDPIGRTIPNAKLFFYFNGTLDAKATYEDSDYFSESPHPVVADGAGRFPAIFLGGGLYTVVLKDSDEVTISTSNGIGGLHFSTSSLIQTSDAVATPIFTFDSENDAIPDETTGMVEWRITGVQEGGGAFYVGKLITGFQKLSEVFTIISTLDIYEVPATTESVNISISADDLLVEVTGIAATNINWTCEATFTVGNPPLFF